MAYEPKDNTGILSKNDRKEKDSHPEYTGTARIEGVDYWISAWVKTKKDGSGKFFSFSFRQKDQAIPRANRSPHNPGGRQPGEDDDFGDLIPF